MHAILPTVVAAFALLAAPVAFAAEPPQAKTMRTVFVNKGSAAAVTKAVNALHAQMEADGWTVVNVSVYTEDGDLEGLFVTYVRALPPAADGAAAMPAAQ